MANPTLLVRALWSQMSLCVLPAVLAAQTTPEAGLVFRVLGGVAIPVAPSGFTNEWNAGLNGAVTVAWSRRSPVDLSASIERGSFRPEGASSVALWGAWCDVEFKIRGARLRSFVHAGAGVVFFGGAPTAPGLRLGAAGEVPLSARTALVVDAALVHTLTSDPSSQSMITEPFTYAPLRIGLTWR
jgi:hypothetical protein